MLYLRTQLDHIRLQTRHLSRQHPHLSLDSVKSKCQRSIDCCHNRVRLRRQLHKQEPQVSSYCKEPTLRPVRMLPIGLLAHVGPLHNVFFESVELPELSAPGLLLQGSSCNCADSSSAAGVAVSGSRYRKGVSSDSSSVGEHDILRRAVPLQSPQSRRQCSVTYRKFTISN